MCAAGSPSDGHPLGGRHPLGHGRTNPGYGGRIKKLIAQLTLWIARYRLVQGPPSDSAFVLVAAPHTSNWDFPLMLAMAWQSGVKVRWLGKDAMFKGVFGPIMRALGGIPVDRENPAGMVEGMAAQFDSGESFALVVPAEGTRGKGEYWKSGFRRIAAAADVPIVLSRTSTARPAPAGSGWSCAPPTTWWRTWTGCASSTPTSAA